MADIFARVNIKAKKPLIKIKGREDDRKPDWKLSRMGSSIRDLLTKKKEE